MRRQARGTLAVLLAAGIALAASATTGAQTSGNETISGVIVTSGASGQRTVVSSVIVARGVFTGVGRIVEIASLPSDPDNVARDDLVFADGSIHLVSTTVDATVSVNPHTCIVTIKLQQTGSVSGGTGRFSAATGSFAGTLSAVALARRNPDGSCSEQQAPLVEVDTFTSSGSLSF